MSYAPYRLTAIHAIELYLSAYLLHRGLAAHEIRSMQHDIGHRARLAQDDGLNLKRRTMDALIAAAEKREYLIARYGTRFGDKLPPPNRTEASLAEVAAKVSVALNKSSEIRPEA